ncbi:hypothetical protein [Mariniblastus fucicola]|uniref:hypothetical protein n=1 Tax=Mariniblastus fucicola TaxID=980251 RepID=UPI0011DF52EB|nr:hypothetical protein [Mariniblastus fucicola]
MTAAMAGAFAFQEQLTNMNRGIDSDVLWFELLQRFVYSTQIGVPFAALYRFAIQKRTTGRYLLQPGHWVLVSVLISVVGYLIPMALFLTLFGQSSLDGDGGFDHWVLLFLSISSLVSAIVLVFGAIRYRRMWRAVLLLLAIHSLVNAVLMVTYMTWNEWTIYTGYTSFVSWFAILDWIEIGINGLLALALIALVASEIFGRVRRDLWHWLGILAIFIAAVASPAISFIYNWINA